MMRARQCVRACLLLRSACNEAGETFKLRPAGYKSALTVLFVLFLLCEAIFPSSACAQPIPLLSLSSSPGGITVTPSGTNQWSGQFGTMNALGIGAPSAGVSVIPLSNGALYFSLYRLTVQNLPGNHTATVTAYVSTGFGHPAALVMESCPSTLACNTSGDYSVMSTNPAAQTTIIPSVGNTTVTAGLGVFLPDTNGPGVFTGTDTVRITLTATDLNNGHNESFELRLDSPQGETVQNAIGLTLASAAGGLAVTAAADYSMNFGNVNGLGIGPNVGLTAVAATGGTVYSTPYLLQPAFSGFVSTGATIGVFASTNFAHPTILKLEDAAALAGPFSLISTNAGTQTLIASAAASRTAITRFLGLFVSNVNGPTVFAGSDNATLTFTMTVP
jgi:hypothetical protein